MRRARPDQRAIAFKSVCWPTVLLAVLCHALWVWLVLNAARIGIVSATVALAFLLTLYSSLQHEVLHGHPFRSHRLNTLLVWPAYGLVIPYGRFRTLHLAHHRDERLTDPYDDPESNFLDPATWHSLPQPVQCLLAVNNTLAGRMLIGPLLGLLRLYVEDARRVADGDRQCRQEWLAHIPPLLLVTAILCGPGDIPAEAYLLAAFCSLGILRIRTFLEHRAHDDIAGRTVIIESRGPLALLFLFNNFHAVHHTHPRMPWYRLPGYFRRHRHAILARNGEYHFPSYLAVMRSYLWRSKDPVPHPLHDGVRRGRGARPDGANPVADALSTADGPCTAEPIPDPATTSIAHQGVRTLSPSTGVSRYCDPYRSIGFILDR